MSLDWNIENVQDWETVCKDDDGITLSAVTNALIWATTGVGLGEITEANLDEFAWRLDLYQKIYEPLIVEVKDDEFVPRFITYTEVKQHVGLHTNVSRETRAQWLKRITEFSFNDFVRYRKVEA